MENMMEKLRFIQDDMVELKQEFIDSKRQIVRLEAQLIKSQTKEMKMECELTECKDKILTAEQELRNDKARIAKLEEELCKSNSKKNFLNLEDDLNYKRNCKSVKVENDLPDSNATLFRLVEQLDYFKLRIANLEEELTNSHEKILKVEDCLNNSERKTVKLENRLTVNERKTESLDKNISIIKNNTLDNIKGQCVLTSSEVRVLMEKITSVDRKCNEATKSYERLTKLQCILNAKILESQSLESQKCHNQLLNKDVGDSVDSAAVSRPCYSLGSRPEKLQQTVDADNGRFYQEIAARDKKMWKKTATMSVMVLASQASASSTATVSTMTPSVSALTSCSANFPRHAKQNLVGVRTSANDPDVLVTEEQRPGESAIIQPSLNSTLACLPNQHAALSLQATLTAIQDVVDELSSGLFTSQDVLDTAIEKEYQRLKGFSHGFHDKLPSEDLRLTHFVLYLMVSGADQNTVKVALSEQFSLSALMDSVCNGVRQRAQQLHTRLHNASRVMYLSGGKGVNCHEFWHQRYSHFRQAISWFVSGLEAYCRERYQEALPFFNQAWLHNCEPGLDSITMATGGINPSMLAYFRRQSLLQLNETTMEMFESDSDMTDSLTIMTEQILPSLSHVVTSGLKEDFRTAEDIRERWCQFLCQDLGRDKMEQLQDFLSKMFDSKLITNEEPGLVRASEVSVGLFDRYIRAMRKVKDKGELDRWMEAC